MADGLLSRYEANSPSADEHIADLGCGTGYLLEQLQRRGFIKLCGFDISRDMLEIARSSTLDTAVKLTEADLQTLPVSDEQFDTIFSNAAIQWCDTARVAAEVCRVLRPGGRGFISTFGPRTLEQWRSVFQTHGHNSVHTFESPAQLIEKFEKSRLRVNRIETKVVTESFGSVKDMFESIKKLGASNAAISRKPISKSAYRSIHTAFEQQLAREDILNLTFETISFEAVRL